MLCIGSELWWNSQCPQTMHPKSGDNLSQILHAEARGNIRMADVYCVNAILQLFQKSRWCPRFVPNLSPVNHGIINIHCQDRMIKCQHLLFEGRSHLRSLVESWSLQIWELSLAHSIDCSVRNLNCLVAPSQAHILRKWTFTHSITVLTVFLAQLMELLSWQSLVAYTVSTADNGGSYEEVSVKKMHWGGWLRQELFPANSAYFSIMCPKRSPTQVAFAAYVSIIYHDLSYHFHYLTCLDYVNLVWYVLSKNTLKKLKNCPCYKHFFFFPRRERVNTEK